MGVESLGTLPVELIVEVVKQLSLDGLRNIRLACSWLARIAKGPLYKQIGVLKSLESFNELRSHIMKDPGTAVHVKSLTIYHATWPACPRSVWETHPLLLGGNERMVVDVCQNHLADMAYDAFQGFVVSQDACTVDLLVSILDLLPSLSRVEVHHVRRWKRIKHPRYLRLRKQIWLEPYTNDPVGATVEMALQAVRTRRVVSTIQVTGMFQSARLAVPNLSYLTNVILTSLNNVAAQELQSFLACFSELRELSLGMMGRQCHVPFHLQSLSLPKLITLELHCCSISGRSLAGFVKLNVAVANIFAYDVAFFGIKRSDLIKQVPILTIKTQYESRRSK